MSRIKLTFDNRRFQRDVKRVQRQLDKLAKEGRREATDAMGGEAKKILHRSKQLVPVRTGRLRDSARLRETEKAGGKEFQISFGGGDIDYAWPVHERSDLKHKKGTHHYLASAAKEQARGLAKRVAAKVSTTLKRILR